MARKTRYHSVRSSSDSIHEADEQYYPVEAGLCLRLKELFLGFENWSRFHSISAAALYVASAILLMASSRFPSDGQCTRKMSTWSPMFEAVEYEWRFWDNISPNDYMGKPTKDLEIKWDHLWQWGSMGISASQLHLFNKSLDENWLYTPEKLGGGITTLFEGFHQVHCINLVRQYTYRDEYDYDGLPAFDKSPAMLLDHVEHCIEMLRVVLMCQSDETPYPIEVKIGGDEAVQTNSLHRCRKYERLMEWAEGHVVEPYNATLELIKHADKHYDKNKSTAVP